MKFATLGALGIVTISAVLCVVCQAFSNTAGDPFSLTLAPRAYNYSEVLGLSLLFYEAQRCGPLPADNRIQWRGDSFLGDSDPFTNVDLTGGYFDAGDHVKFGFPMAGFSTIIGWGLLDYKDGYVLASQYENGLKALRWFLDYFMKAHVSLNELYGQVGSGHIDHSYWGRPEDWPAWLARPAYKITATAPGSELAAETAAALTVGYMIFHDEDPAYAAECLRHAEELYNFANTYRGLYHEAITDVVDFYRSRDYGDELGWAAAWLYRATQDEKYLTDFRNHWDEFNLAFRPERFDWQFKHAGLQVLMAKVTNEQVYKDSAQAFCDFVLYEAPRSPKGLAFLSECGSLRTVSNAVFVCMQAADIGISTEAYRQFALQQMGYILGDTGRTYVVGYGLNSPRKPHHRAISCPDLPAPCTEDALTNPGPNPQILYGALVGGPDLNDQWDDDREDYVKNEVATDYNAGFQSALAGLAALVQEEGHEPNK